MLKLAVVFLSSILLGVCDAQQECQEGVVYENGTTCVDFIIVLPENEEAEKILNYEVIFFRKSSNGSHHIVARYYNDTVLAWNSTLTFSQCGLDPCQDYIISLAGEYRVLSNESSEVVPDHNGKLLPGYSTITICQCGLDSCQEDVGEIYYDEYVYGNHYFQRNFYHTTNGPCDPIPPTTEESSQTSSAPDDPIPTTPIEGSGETSSAPDDPIPTTSIEGSGETSSTTDDPIPTTPTELSTQTSSAPDNPISTTLIEASTQTSSTTDDPIPTTSTELSTQTSSTTDDPIPTTPTELSTQTSSTTDDPIPTTSTELSTQTSSTTDDPIPTTPTELSTQTSSAPDNPISTTLIEASTQTSSTTDDPIPTTSTEMSSQTSRVAYENGTVCVDLAIVLLGNEIEKIINYTVAILIKLDIGIQQVAFYYNDTVIAGNSAITVSQCGLDPGQEYYVEFGSQVKLRTFSKERMKVVPDYVGRKYPWSSAITVCQLGSCQQYVVEVEYMNSDAGFPIFSTTFNFTTTNGTITTTVTTDPPTTSVTTTTEGMTGFICSERQLINNYTFPPQLPGIVSFSVETCKDDWNTPLASIRCSSKGVYDLDTFQTSTCLSIGFVISQNFTNSTLNQLEILTAKPEVLTEENVTDVTEYLFNVSGFNVTFSEEQIGETAEISSHLTAYYRDEALPTEFIAEKQKLVKSITDISRKVEFDSGTSSVTKLSDNVNIEVREVQQSTPGNTDYTFNATFYENDDAASLFVPISIKIPAAALDIAESFASSNIRIVSVGFRTSFLFPSERTSDWVISSSLGDSSGTVEVNSLSDNSIVITSDRTEEPGKKKVDDFKAELVELECVFWNFTIEDWSSEGCTLSKSSPPTCQCNHLTNFAILVSRSEIPADFALTIVTYVGGGLSIICFIATLLVICFSKTLRNRYHMRILGNICLCLAVSFTLFVFGVDYRVHTVNCSVLTVFMHFFFLASWFWMSVYSYTIYRDIVKVMKSYGRTFKLRFAACFAYGMPLLIVLIDSSVSLGHIDHDFPDDPKAVSSYRAQNFCWLRLYSLYFGFLLPVGILLLFNFVMFCFVIYELTCRRQKIQSSKKKSGSGSNVVTIIVLVTTMGLTWVFGYLMLVSDNMSFLLAMSWLFTIVTSFQGVFMFYFTAVRSGELGRLCAPVIKKFSIITTGFYAVTTVSKRATTTTTTGTTTVYETSK